MSRLGSGKPMPFTILETYLFTACLCKTRRFSDMTQSSSLLKLSSLSNSCSADSVIMQISHFVCLVGAWSPIHTHKVFVFRHFTYCGWAREVAIGRFRRCSSWSLTKNNKKEERLDRQEGRLLARFLWPGLTYFRSVVILVTWWIF